MTNAQWAQPNRESHSEREMRAMNEALLTSSVRQHELLERAENAEAEARENELRLAEELDSLSRLNELSSRLWRMRSLRAGAEEMLGSSIELLNAEVGTLHLFDADGGSSYLAAQRGLGELFPDDIREFFHGLHPSAYGESGSTIHLKIEPNDSAFHRAPFLDGDQTAAYRSLRSTSLYDARGAPLGLLSTYSRSADRPLEQSLRSLQLYARQAAEFVERCRNEEALKASERRHRLALESAELGYWNVEPATCALTSDSRFRAIFGVRASQLTYEQAIEIIHPEDRDAVQNAVAAAMHPLYPSSYEVEYRVVLPDGAVRWVFAKGRANFAGEGADRILVSFDGTIADVTERKLLEAERAVVSDERQQLLESERAARSEAEHAGRMKDEFLATLSHELRTPLNAILGYAQLMTKTKMGAGETFEAAKTIERNARVQAQLIEELLDMNRIVSGKIRLEIQALDLSALILDAIATVRPSAEAKGIHIEPKLAELTNAVRGDPGRIQQIVWNLLSNAVKFTARQGEIRVVLEPSESSVVISVSDTGLGIAPEFLPHVFDRFRQADGTTTRQQAGLGLGLAIVKQLVELHGGVIRAESAGEGQGSTFIVTLPLGVPIQSSGEAPVLDKRSSLSVDGSHLDLGGVRVLVVDDEADATRLVKRVLAECKADVSEASSAQEALGKLHEAEFDVLVSDIGMPGEDGYQFIRKVRAMNNSNRKIPAVAVTAFARSEDRRRAAMAGFQTQLSKPLDAPELLAIVANLSGRAGAG